MRPLRLLAAVAVVALLASCADEPVVGAPGPDGEPRRYEADGTVLEAADHGPELCLGGVAESYPPQCSGVPLTSWDWANVEGEESASGTTWGEFHVVGTYDGSTFAVESAGPFVPPDTGSVDFTPPCPEPAGGWVAADPGRTSEDDRNAVMHAAEAEDDSAGFWIDYTVEPTEGPFGPDDIVVVAAFTGDLERHESDLRALWGGPLCVTQLERTSRELNRIQSELGGEVGAELGLEVLWSGGNVVENLVEVGVVVADEDDGIAVEERYGAGAVRLVPALTPVAGS